MDYSSILYIVLIIGLIYAMTVVASSVLKTVIIITLIIVVFKFLYNIFFGKSQYLTTGISDATIQQVISASDLAVNSTNSQPTNFTYSIWVYIDDWNYKYGIEKPIILRDVSTLSSAASSTTTTPVVINPGTIIPSPFIYLGADSNKLVIHQAVYPSSGTSSTPTTNDVDKVERRLEADEKDFKDFKDYDLSISNSDF